MSRSLIRSPALRGVAVAVSLLVLGPMPARAQEVRLIAPEVAPPQVDVQVEWSGPGARGDFLTLAEPNSGSADYLDYARTASGSPAALTPPGPGVYELRYVAAAGLQVLARRRITIAKPVAEHALGAPPVAEAGTEITVNVTGTTDPVDYVTVVSVGAGDLEVGPYARLRGAAAVTVPTPAAAGNHEVRLVRARGQEVLVRLPLTVTAPPKPEPPVEAEPPEPGDIETATASPASPPGPVEAIALLAVDTARDFGVAFQGEVSDGIRLYVLPEGRSPGADDLGLNFGGRPVVRLRAPNMPGRYDILIVSDGGEILHRRPLEVR